MTTTTPNTPKVKDDEHYLKTAPIHKAITHLAIPMMLAMSVSTIYNIINAYFIGTLHSTSMLAALTYGLPIFIITLGIGGIFGVGGSTYISRLLGEGNKTQTKHVSAFVLYGSLTLGTIVTILALTFLNPIITALGTDPTSYNATRNYTFMLILWIPIFVTNFGIEQIVRATGATKQSMYGMLIATITNLAFDALFILALHMGVEGAALATGIANLISLTYYIHYLHKNKPEISLHPKNFTINKNLLKQIFGIGISDLIQTSFILIASLTLNHIAAKYGDNLLAAFGISMRITQLPEALCMGIFLGIMPLIAYTHGNKNLTRMHNTLKQSAIWMGVIIITFSGLVYLYRTQILTWFTTDPKTLNIGLLILIAMLVSTLFNGYTGLLLTYFQATGKAKAATILSTTQGIILIPGIIILSATLGLNGIVWSLPISEATALLVGLILYTSTRKQHTTTNNTPPNQALTAAETELKTEILAIGANEL